MHVNTILDFNHKVHHQPFISVGKSQKTGPSGGSGQSRLFLSQHRLNIPSSTNCPMGEWCKGISDCPVVFARQTAVTDTQIRQGGLEPWRGERDDEGS